MLQFFACSLVCHGTVVLGSCECVDEVGVGWIAFKQIKFRFFYSVFIESDVSESCSLFCRVYQSGVVQNIWNCSVANVEFLLEHVCEICLFSHFGVICWFRCSGRWCWRFISLQWWSIFVHCGKRLVFFRLLSVPLLKFLIVVSTFLKNFFRLIMRFSDELRDPSFLFGSILHGYGHSCVIFRHYVVPCGQLVLISGLFEFFQIGIFVFRFWFRRLLGISFMGCLDVARSGWVFF